MNGRGRDHPSRSARRGRDLPCARWSTMVRRAQGDALAQPKPRGPRRRTSSPTARLTVGIVTLVVWLAVGGGLRVRHSARMRAVMVIACPHALPPRRAAGGCREHPAERDERPLDPRPGELRARPQFSTAVVFRQDRHAHRGPLPASSDVIPSRRPLLGRGARLGGRAREPVRAPDRPRRHPVRAGAGPRLSSPCGEFRNLPGEGAQAVVAGRDVKVVGPPPPPPATCADAASRPRATPSRMVADQGKTVVYVLPRRGGRPARWRWRT